MPAGVRFVRSASAPLAARLLESFESDDRPAGRRVLRDDRGGEPDLREPPRRAAPAGSVGRARRGARAHHATPGARCPPASVGHVEISGPTVIERLRRAGLRGPLHRRRLAAHRRPRLPRRRRLPLPGGSQRRRHQPRRREDLPPRDRGRPPPRARGRRRRGGRPGRPVFGQVPVAYVALRGDATRRGPGHDRSRRCARRWSPRSRAPGAPPRCASSRRSRPGRRARSAPRSCAAARPRRWPRSPWRDPGPVARRRRAGPGGGHAPAPRPRRRDAAGQAGRRHLDARDHLPGPGLGRAGAGQPARRHALLARGLPLRVVVHARLQLRAERPGRAAPLLEAALPGGRGAVPDVDRDLLLLRRARRATGLPLLRPQHVDGLGLDRAAPPRPLHAHRLLPPLLPARPHRVLRRLPLGAARGHGGAARRTAA